MSSSVNTVVIGYKIIVPYSRNKESIMHDRSVLDELLQNTINDFYDKEI